jgi:hypothetical protein
MAPSKKCLHRLGVGLSRRVASMVDLLLHHILTALHKLQVFSLCISHPNDFETVNRGTPYPYNMILGISACTQIDSLKYTTKYINVFNSQWNFLYQARKMDIPIELERNPHAKDPDMLNIMLCDALKRHSAHPSRWLFSYAANIVFRASG